MNTLSSSQQGRDRAMRFFRHMLPTQHAHRQARQQDHTLTAVLLRAEQSARRQQPDGAAAAQQRQLWHQQVKEVADGVALYPVEDRPVETHAAVTPLSMRRRCSSTPTSSPAPSRNTSGRKVAALRGGWGVCRLAGPMAMAYREPSIRPRIN